MARVMFEPITAEDGRAWLHVVRRCGGELFALSMRADIFGFELMRRLENARRLERLLDLENPGGRAYVHSLLHVTDEYGILARVGAEWRA